ncbi:hypothetical protein QG516_17000 [Pedobacter gandavensis]|uniref:hypothetical protein n=1 Tax=Pedobacter TaxID=84567 RepID=UPI001C9A0BE7|nr:MULTISPECIES: hypothetical protein [Pedobacter]WGQ08236.1 hypothetical protein QG516_17000 [Pedobacter gandavensis]
MLSKSFSIFHVFARQKKEKTEKALTQREWINADRIVLIFLLLATIIGAIVFS